MTYSARNSQSRFSSFFAAALCLLTMLVLMISSGWNKKLSFDEFPNLHYGYRVFTEGPGAVPDGQRPIMMTLNALPCLHYGCDPVQLDASETKRLTVRFPTMIFALLTGLLIYMWSKELWGPWAALLGPALYCFNPNFIAHGKQVTSDVSTSFFVLLSVYLFRKLLKDRSWKLFLALSATVSGAILAKYSSMLLIPIFTVLWLAFHFHKTRKAPSFKEILGFASLSFLTGFLVLIFINTAFLFKGSFTPGRDYTWQSASFQKKFGKTALPIPLPKTFALGLDYTSYLQEHPELGRGSNYILGKLHRKGRWFSFPIMILLKTPLAFLILLGLARFNRTRPWIETAFYWIPFGIWLLIFSVACHAQLGIRYILPALVFLFVDAGRFLKEPLSLRTKAVSWFLLVWAAASVLLYHPHEMSYFNELIGRRVNAYKYLSDSNLDWEDKSYFLKQYALNHPEIKFALEPKQPVSGYIVAGGTPLTGVVDERRFKWLRENFKPLRTITFSHFLYYVPAEQLPAVLTPDNHE